MTVPTIRRHGERALTFSFIALVVILWFGSTFALLGDTGKFSDDYLAHLINPLTGEVDFTRHPWTRWPYFWRPLHLAHVYIVNTLSFERPWIGHLELALVHLGVCVLLFRVLTAFGAGRFIAACCAVLFMVCPLHAEAVLWTSASCNAISCVFLLWLMLIVRRHAAERVTPLRLGAVFVLAFVIACWYEPAAGALLAMPMVARSGLPPGLARAERLRRVWLPTLVAGAACVMYVALLLITAPGGARGESGSLVPMARLPTRVAEFVPQAVDVLVGTRAGEVLSGAHAEGRRALEGGPARVWLVLLIAACGVCVLACARWMFWVRAARPDRSSGSGWAVPCGGLIAAGAFIPVLLTQSPGVDLRTLYVPLLGLAIAGAGAADLAYRRAGWLHPKVVPCALGTLAVGVGVHWAIACVGFQVGFREQARLDASIVESLRALLREPPPDTVFLPLIIDAKPVTTGQRGFDEFFRGAFELPSAITPLLREGFRRREISGVALTYRLNGDVPIHALTPSGFELRRVRGGATEGALRIAWARAMPFTVDGDGVLRTVSELSVVPLSGQPFVVRTKLGDGVAVELQELPDRVTRVRRRPH